MAVALEIGSAFTVVKGSTRLQVRKGEIGTVTEIKHLGKEYGWEVLVRLKIGRDLYKTLYARHKNRLSDDVVRLKWADPTVYIEIVRT